MTLTKLATNNYFGTGTEEWLSPNTGPKQDSRQTFHNDSRQISNSQSDSIRFCPILSDSVRYSFQFKLSPSGWVGAFWEVAVAYPIGTNLRIRCDHHLEPFLIAWGRLRALPLATHFAKSWVGEFFRLLKNILKKKSDTIKICSRMSRNGLF